MAAIRIVDVVDDETFRLIPPCADPGFDHRSCDYWEDADRGSKAARPARVGGPPPPPPPPPARSRQSVRPDEPRAGVQPVRAVRTLERARLRPVRHRR